MMVDRRTVHCGGFMGCLLGKTLPDVFLKSICYPTFSRWARRYPVELAQPAHTEFVICDYAIENRLHWRRDVTLREDHCQVRKGAAPQVLAALNNLVLALFDFLGTHNVPKQMRMLDAQPHRALRLLLGSLLTFT
jgi:hypothetical protein